MEQCTDARAAKFVRPEFGEMIEWKFNAHDLDLSQPTLSGDARVGPIDLNRPRRVYSRQNWAVQVNHPYQFGET
jgi:hypothetical protein